MIYFFIVVIFLLWWFGNPLESGPPILSKRFPIIGHLLMFWGDRVYIFNSLKWLFKETEQLGGVTRSYFGPKLVYFVTDPDDALTISNKCMHKYFIYRLGRPLLKNGLVTANVPTWYKHRKLLNPAFTPQVLYSLLNIFNDQAKRLVEEFAIEEGKAFDHEIVIRKNNLETICASAFGANRQEFSDLQNLYLPNLSSALNIITARIRQPWLVYDYAFNMTRLKKRQDRSLDVLAQLSESIIKKKVEAMKNAQITGVEAEQLNPFLRTILKVTKEGHFTDEETRGEIDTIIVSGHDTTALTLTFVLTMLGSHPEVQEKVYQEILQVMGDCENVGRDDLAKLTYMEAVLKETLRLYPIVSIIARKTDSELRLKNYTLKPGHGVCISIYSILRDKAWGSDRHVFRPERWLEKDSLPDPKYFAAFGLGRRFCIGRLYGMISMKVTLAHVLKHYKIKSDISKLIVQYTILIRPQDGHHITLEKRQK